MSVGTQITGTWKMVAIGASVTVVTGFAAVDYGVAKKPRRIGGNVCHKMLDRFATVFDGDIASPNGAGFLKKLDGGFIRRNKSKACKSGKPGKWMFDSCMKRAQARGSEEQAFQCGVMGPILINTFDKFARRKMAREPRVGLQRLFDSVSRYYAKHGKCPTAEGSQTTIASDVVPAKDRSCAKGPDETCVAMKNPRGAHAYAANSWSNEPVFRALRFSMPKPHRFHYQFTASDDANGCAFTAAAFADLDDDGLFSTYERAGYATKEGVNGASGLYLENELE